MTIKRHPLLYSCGRCVHGVRFGFSREIMCELGKIPQTCEEYEDSKGWDRPKELKK